MGDNDMKFETVLTAMAIVAIGLVAIWYMFGGIIMNAINTIMIVL